MQTMPWLLAMRVETLCRKSLRMLRMLRCNRATRSRALDLFLEPFFFRLNCFDSLRNLANFRFSGFGDSRCSPFDKTAKVLMPKSIPIGSPTAWADCVRSCSTDKETNQRSTSRLTVAERILPLNFFVDSLVRISPILGNLTPSSVTETAPVNRKLSCSPFFLNLGKPTAVPFLRPRQKFLNARSQSRNASCGAHFDKLSAPGRVIQPWKISCLQRNKKLVLFNGRYKLGLALVLFKPLDPISQAPVVGKPGSS